MVGSAWAARSQTRQENRLCVADQGSGLTSFIHRLAPVGETGDPMALCWKQVAVRRSSRTTHVVRLVLLEGFLTVSLLPGWECSSKAVNPHTEQCLLFDSHRPLEHETPTPPGSERPHKDRRPGGGTGTRQGPTMSWTKENLHSSDEIKTRSDY